MVTRWFIAFESSESSFLIPFQQCSGGRVYVWGEHSFSNFTPIKEYEARYTRYSAVTTLISQSIKDKSSCISNYFIACTMHQEG